MNICIPIKLYFYKKLSSNEKMLLMEIYRLDNGFGTMAHNKHFAETINLCETRCSQLIGKLDKENWIGVTLMKNNIRHIKLLQKFYSTFKAER